MAEDWTESLATDRFVPYPFRPMPYLFWIFCFSISIGGALLFSQGMEHRQAYLGLCISLSAGFLTVPLVFRLAYLRFRLWGESVSSFVVPKKRVDRTSVSDLMKQELLLFRGSATVYVIAAIFAGIAWLVFWEARYPVGFRNLTSIWATILLLCSAFVAGLGLPIIFYACRAIWRVGAFEVRVINHKFGILSTGIMLSQCYFAIAISWAMYSLSAIAGVEREHLSESRLPVLILAMPTFVGFLASFIACQFPLHRRMLEFKQRELQTVETLLDELKPTKSQELTRDLLDKIGFYEKKWNELAALPEWPFDYKALWGAVGSSVTAILPALVSTAFATAAKAAGIFG